VRDQIDLSSEASHQAGDAVDFQPGLHPAHCMSVPVAGARQNVSYGPRMQPGTSTTLSILLSNSGRSPRFMISAATMFKWYSTGSFPQKI
jgi:hypothetical protein